MNAQQREYFLDTETGLIRFLLYVPEDISELESVPALFFLHGAGERGANLAKVKVHGPPRLIEEGKDFPFMVISPQCDEGRWWSDKDILTRLNELYSHMLSAYKIDAGRVYLTGLSMGGFGTWEWAKESPEKFAALVPICGGGDKKKVRKIAGIPTWVFHGAKDEVVPVERSDEMVNWMKNKGAEIKYTIYPDAQHDSWTTTYSNPDLYEWILKQVRRD